MIEQKKRIMYNIEPYVPELLMLTLTVDIYTMLNTRNRFHRTLSQRRHDLIDNWLNVEHILAKLSQRGNL